ncbi:MAG: metal-dependent hydrolase [Methylophagaceae bacterium]
MDPLSQGIVGASASQVTSNRKEIVAASLIGFFSGMAADLDIFIRSTENPLLFLEFHRQFTHSILFMPLGGLICATVFYFLIKLFFKNQSLSFARIYLFSFAGYATHGFLDACTSYGTQLFWPFSDERITWNNISIIDPLFTLPLLLIVSIALFKQSRKLAIIGACYGLLYLSLGLVQEQRALTAAQELADMRGHQAINVNVKPSFMNIIIWKSIYEHDGRYYSDAIRILGESSFFEGESTPKLNIDRDLSWLDRSSQQAIDIERFRWFAAQHLALDPNNPSRIIDVRYSMLPNQIDGLWGIELNQSANTSEHSRWIRNSSRNDRSKNIAQLWSMILGQGSPKMMALP